MPVYWYGEFFSITKKYFAGRVVPRYRSPTFSTVNWIVDLSSLCLVETHSPSTMEIVSREAKKKL